VRAMAAALGLSIWDKPAAACLSSRIPYGTSVTRDRLVQIGSFEAELHRIGLRQVRVRWHELGSDGASTKSGAIARVEVAPDELVKAFELREAIVSAGKRVGFTYVTLDLQGYRTGATTKCSRAGSPSSASATSAPTPPGSLPPLRSSRAHRWRAYDALRTASSPARVGTPRSGSSRYRPRRRTP